MEGTPYIAKTKEHTMNTTGKLKIDTTGKWSAKVAEKRTWVALCLIDDAQYNGQPDIKKAAAELVETNNLTETMLRQLLEGAQKVIGDRSSFLYHDIARILISALREELKIHDRNNALASIGI